MDRVALFLGLWCLNAAIIVPILKQAVIAILDSGMHPAHKGAVGIFMLSGVIVEHRGIIEIVDMVCPQ